MNNGTGNLLLSVPLLFLQRMNRKRDVERLTSEQLQKKYGIAQADVMVLFGGSIHFSHSTVVKQRYKAAAKNCSMFFFNKSKIVRIFNLKIKRITAYKMVDC